MSDVDRIRKPSARGRWIAVAREEWVERTYRAAPRCGALLTGATAHSSRCGKVVDHRGHHVSEEALGAAYVRMMRKRAPNGLIARLGQPWLFSGRGRSYAEDEL